MKSYLSQYFSDSDLPCDYAYDNRHFAGVALILTGQRLSELESLYIRRAYNPRDPWSGQIGLPGGRVNQRDNNHKETAIRETQEEVNIELNDLHYLGFLDRFQAARPGLNFEMNISTFVFYLPEKPRDIKLQPSEVADVLWRPLSYIQAPERQTTYLFEKNHAFDAVDLFNSHPNSHSHVNHLQAINNGDMNNQVNNEILWGITYRMMKRFSQLIF